MTKIRRSAKAFTAKSEAKASSRQTCDGGDVKVCCRENTAISLDKVRRSVKAFAAKCNAKVNSRQTCDGGDEKVSCSGEQCQISC